MEFQPFFSPQGSLLTTSEFGTTANFGEYTLSSHFQPIYGLSVQRPVGHEALLRSRDEIGTAVAPPTMFSQLPADQRPQLDELCQLLHIQNFQNMASRDGWLFLNMTPEVFLQARKAPRGQAFGDMLVQQSFPPHLLVIEVLEEAVRDNAEFESAVAYFRELGCLIALDDFGAGSSNFDRVWKIRPQIVKLDRSLIVQAANNKRISRLLPQMISLLHEAGAMVLVEGIETAEEAYIALDADADFAQGYYFGRPRPVLASQNEAKAVISQVWSAFEENWKNERQQSRNKLAPYMNAIGYASVLLSSGRAIPESCASFLELAGANFCYLLDQNGRQIGFNLWSSASCPGADPRLAPLRNTNGARWTRRPYFRRAIENFGKVQVTRPYFSSSSANLCVTVSISFKIDGETRVICGDVSCHQDMLA